VLTGACGSSLTFSEFNPNQKSRKFLVVVSIKKFTVTASSSTYSVVTTDKWTVTNTTKLEIQVLWNVKPCRMKKDSLIQKRRALRPSETSARIYKSIRRSIPEDWDLHQHRCTNLKSRMVNITGDFRESAKNSVLSSKTQESEFGKVISKVFSV